ncbi:MAG: hypothetical protein FGM24_06595 [Candidatus Kapabacteria bacterium]|nr:hypothetical protein [Candidatus Kapabacteria bacterium]
MSDLHHRGLPLIPATIQLSSLLDLSTRLAESDSEERLLNAAVLSVMGKLKILRACVLQPDQDGWVVTHAKGIASMRFGRFESLGIRYTSAYDDTAALHAAGIYWIVPLMVRGATVAMLCFGPTIDGSDTSEDVRTYMGLVQSITATSLHNAQMVQSLLATTQELQRRNLLVTTLFESARDFSGMTDVATIFRTLSYRLMGQLMISSFALYLREPLNGQTILVNRTDTPSFANVAPDVLGITSTLRVAGIADDPDVQERLLDANVAAVAALTVHGTAKGAIAVGPKLNGGAFSDEELSFLESLGNTAMAAIENDRAVERELERLKLENELSIAASIQRGLLPLHLPVVQGYDIAASTIPSKQVSGDYYDVISLDAHRTLLAIADVSGKGIPASLVMANVQAALNVLATLDLQVDSIADRINRLVCDNTEPDVFVTMFIGVLDTSTHTLSYVNMGHNPPVMISGREGGNVTLLKDGGVLAGVIPNPKPYRTGTIDLQEQDVLVLYTDGVTEARNDGYDEYGMDALTHAIRQSRALPAQGILSSLLTDVKRHANARPLDDDTSILILKRRDTSV